MWTHLRVTAWIAYLLRKNPDVVLEQAIQTKFLVFVAVEEVILILTVLQDEDTVQRLLPLLRSPMIGIEMGRKDLTNLLEFKDGDNLIFWDKVMVKGELDVECSSET